MLIGKKNSVGLHPTDCEFPQPLPHKKTLAFNYYIMKMHRAKNGTFLTMNTKSSYSVNFRLSHLVKSGNRPAGTGGARGIQLPRPHQ